jgi:hypothetical protein
MRICRRQRDLATRLRRAVQDHGRYRHGSCAIRGTAPALTDLHPDYVREKIRASQLINRLQKCAFGEISLTRTQLRAIEILLRKSIPDLAAAEIKSEQTHRYVAELPPVLSKEEWLEKYGKCDQGVRLPDKPDRPLH